MVPLFQNLDTHAGTQAIDVPPPPPEVEKKIQIFRERGKGLSQLHEVEALAKSFDSGEGGNLESLFNYHYYRFLMYH